jgi:hypothetical protein
MNSCGRAARGVASAVAVVLIPTEKIYGLDSFLLGILQSAKKILVVADLACNTPFFVALGRYRVRYLAIRHGSTAFRKGLKGASQH